MYKVKKKLVPVNNKVNLAELIKNSQNITPQEFYAKIFGYKRPDKNDWKVTEGVSSIDATQTGNTVHIDFTSTNTTGQTA